jgi:hypothetical protein
MKKQFTEEHRANMKAASERRNDLTGQVFNKLTVIGRSGIINASRQVMWVCKCDCGNPQEVLANSTCLKTGAIKSCKCLWGKYEDRVEAIKARLYSIFIAKKRNQEIGINLTSDEYKSLIEKDCYYCGSSPSNKMSDSTTDTVYFYNGLDRKDSGKCYTLDNVVPSCWTCNRAKGSLSHKEFIDWIVKGYIFLKENGEI